MSRCMVNVATGSYVRGQERLTEKLALMGEDYLIWRDKLPAGSPAHSDVPYAFKAYALKEAFEQGFTTLLWCDACILPVNPLGPLWERIESEGYWFSKNGFSNYEWTAESAYPDLFKFAEAQHQRRLNRAIHHVVATAFGVSVNHPKGRRFLEEYYRLASQTRAFCGPWKNESASPCGPSDVRGHRHDQTAASVIAWRLSFQLTDPPDVFSYPPGDERTILLADGAY